MNIYIGNINYKLSEEELQQIFEEYGDVVSLKIIKDKRTGRSKGYGFVEMSNKESALQAIENLNRKEILGRKIVLSVAKLSQTELEVVSELMLN